MNRRSFLGSLLALPFIRSLPAKVEGTPLAAAAAPVLPREWEQVVYGSGIPMLHRKLRLVDRPAEIAEGTQVRSTWSDEG